MTFVAYRHPVCSYWVFMLFVLFSSLVNISAAPPPQLDDINLSMFVKYQLIYYLAP